MLPETVARILSLVANVDFYFWALLRSAASITSSYWLDQRLKPKLDVSPLSHGAKLMTMNIIGFRPL